jgi:hypothetical protein
VSSTWRAADAARAVGCSLTTPHRKLHGFLLILFALLPLKISVADPDSFDTDPDSAFYFDTDPDLAFQFDTDPDPAG